MRIWYKLQILLVLNQICFYLNFLDLKNISFDRCRYRNVQTFNVMMCINVKNTKQSTVKVKKQRVKESNRKIYGKQQQTFWRGSTCLSTGGSGGGDPPSPSLPTNPRRPACRPAGDGALPEAGLGTAWLPCGKHHKLRKPTNKHDQKSGPLQDENDSKESIFVIIFLSDPDKL